MLVTWKVYNKDLPETETIEEINGFDAPFEILYGSTTNSFTVDQRRTPSHERDTNGTWWHRLAVIKPGTTSLTVKLKTSANGRVVADAVRLVEIGARTTTKYDAAGNPVLTTDAVGSPTITQYDERNRLIGVYQPVPSTAITPFTPNPVDFTAGETGWTQVTDSRAYGGSYFRATESATEYVLWDLPTLPNTDSTRNYAILATWVPSEQNSSQAIFTSVVGGSLGGSYIVDQRVAPADYQDAQGHWWKILDVIRGPADANSTLDLLADVGAQADAVGLLEVGPTTTYYYDAAGQLSWSLDHYFRQTDYEYDKLGRQIKVSLPPPDWSAPTVRPVITATYDAVGNVTSTTDALGNTTFFEYDNLGRQTLVVQPPATTPVSPPGPVDNGTASGWTAVSPAAGYNGGSIYHAAGTGSNTYTWTSATLTDDKTYYVYVTWPDALSSRAMNAPFEVFKSNTSGDVSLGTFYANQQALPQDYVDGSNNRWHRLGVFTLPDGYDKVKVRLSDAADGNVIADAVYFVEAGPVSRTHYDAAGQVENTIDPLGAVTSYLYDKYGRVTQVTMPDPDGPGGTQYTSPVHKTAYDANGNIASMTDPAGNTTHFEYDNLGRRTEVIHPLASGTPSNRSKDDTDGTEAPPHYLYGEWDEEEGGNENDHRFATAGTANTTSVYDIAYGLDATKTYQVFVRWMPSQNNATDVRYDLYVNGGWNQTVSVNQQIAPQDYVDASGVAWHRLLTFTGLTHYAVRLNATTSVGNGTATHVDDDGVLIAQWESSGKTVYDAASQLTSTIDAIGRITSYDYDNWGRQIAVNQPDPDGPSGTKIPAKTVLEYDANGNVRDEKQRVTISPDTFLTTEHRYDRLGRKIMTIDAAHAGTSVGTTFVYDAVGTLTSLTDAENNETKFTYDNLNRLTTETNELDDVRSFEHDLNGQRTKRTDRNERVVEWFYDNLGRMTKEKWEQGATDRELTFGYDLAGRMISTDDSDTRGRDYDYVFDELGRLEETEWAMAGRLYTMVNEYDQASRRTERNLSYDPGAPYYPVPDFIVDNWAYDNLGRMTLATQEGLAWILDKSARFAYNAAGQLTEIKRYNDLTASNLIVDTDYTYDDAGRLKILTHKDFNGTTTYAGYTYDWDALNRMTSMDFTATGRDDEDATFTHDASGQLTGAGAAARPTTKAMCTTTTAIATRCCAAECPARTGRSARTTSSLATSPTPTSTTTKATAPSGSRWCSTPARNSGKQPAPPPNTSGTSEIG